VQQIGSKLTEQTGDNKATQKISINVNVTSTISSSQDWAEFASLPVCELLY